MRERRHSAYIAFILLISTLAFLPFSSKASPTNISIEPPLTTTEGGKYLTVDINISGVSQLTAWQLKLYYNSTVLNGTLCTQGSFLSQIGSTFFWIIQFDDKYNATHGILEAACSLIGSTSGANGTGTLASVTFFSLNEGNTTLHLEDTKLGDAAIPPNPIPHTTTNGNVQVISTSDIAVTNVTPLKTIVGQGYSMRINVTVENQGDQTETFNVTVYTNTTAIETQTVNSIPNGTSTILTFTWNTTGFAKGNYTISAYAWPVPGETDISNNTLTDGWVVVTIPGDVDGDFDVDIYDVVKITGIYASRQGDLQFNPNSDLDDDGEITIYDVVRCTSHYGQHYP
jgi:hypothetical protein